MTCPDCGDEIIPGEETWWYGYCWPCFDRRRDELEPPDPEQEQAFAGMLRAQERAEERWTAELAAEFN